MRLWILLLLSIITSCTEHTPPKPSEASLSFTVSKWPDHKTAAVTINYDAEYPDAEVNRLIRERNFRIGYELVTGSTTAPTPRIGRALALYSDDISFFCHGEEHISYDHIPPETALASLAKSRSIMSKWGFDTKGMAYPFGRGYRAETQEAVREAGFMFARGVFFRDYESNYSTPLICADDNEQPSNWYYLPSPLVAKYDFTEEDGTTYLGYNHRGVERLLQDTYNHTAWLILVYHSLDDPNSWGYYPLEDFKDDLEAIASRDFWVDHMENVACYIKERTTVKFKTKQIYSNSDVVAFEIRAEDQLPSKVCNLPLTIDGTLTSNIMYAAYEVKRVGSSESTMGMARNKFSFNIVPDNHPYVLTFTAPQTR